MECVIRISSPPISTSLFKSSLGNIPSSFQVQGEQSIKQIHAISHTGSTFRYNLKWARSISVGAKHRGTSSVKSMLCYDKPIPEEIIEKPIGLSLDERSVGDNPRCSDCEAKGAVLCITCSGSGLYVDAILESQGIIVKVKCLGCGGIGNTMCSQCGGRGHL